MGRVPHEWLAACRYPRNATTAFENEDHTRGSNAESAFEQKGYKKRFCAESCWAVVTQHMFLDSRDVWQLLERLTFRMSRGHHSTQILLLSGYCQEEVHSRILLISCHITHLFCLGLKKYAPEHTKCRHYPKVTIQTGGHILDSKHRIVDCQRVTLGRLFCRNHHEKRNVTTAQSFENESVRDAPVATELPDEQIGSKKRWIRECCWAVVTFHMRLNPSERWQLLNHLRVRLWEMHHSTQIEILSKCNPRRVWLGDGREDLSHNTPFASVWEKVCSGVYKVSSLSEGHYPDIYFDFQSG